MQANLAQRPLTVCGYGANAVAVVDRATGNLITAVGTPGQCAFVDGSTGRRVAARLRGRRNARPHDRRNQRHVFTLAITPLGRRVCCYSLNGIYMTPAFDLCADRIDNYIFNGGTPQPGDALTASYPGGYSGFGRYQRVHNQKKCRPDGSPSPRQVICSAAGAGTSLTACKSILRCVRCSSGR